MGKFLGFVAIAGLVIMFYTEYKSIGKATKKMKVKKMD